MTDETYLDLAYSILRKVQGGKEPYAAAVLPMASALHEMLRDPSVVLDAAEALLSPAMGDRQLCFNQRGSTNGVRAFKPVQFWQYAGDGTNVIEGDTLADAYTELLRLEERQRRGKE